MEDCLKIENLLPLYLDEDGLTLEEKVLVEAHISTCPKCKSEIEQMKKTSMLLQHMGSCVFHAPDNFSADVIKRIKEDSHESRVLDFNNPKGIIDKKNTRWLSNHPWAAGIAAAAVITVAIGSFELLPSRVNENPSYVAESTIVPESTNTIKPNVEPNKPLEANENLTKSDIESPEGIIADTLVISNNLGTIENENNTEIPLPPVTESLISIAESQVYDINESDPIIDQSTVFLNQSENIRSTLLKISYFDTESGIVALQEAIRDVDGSITNINLSVDSKCKIFTTSIPRDSADAFINSIIGCSTLISQEQDYKTSTYGQLMEEYLQIQAQLASDPSEDLELQLKTQLAEIEEAMIVAQQDNEFETIVIWVEIPLDTVESEELSEEPETIQNTENVESIEITDNSEIVENN